MLAGILLHLFALPLPNCHSNPAEPAQSAFCATSGSPGTAAVTHGAGTGSTGTRARPPAGWPQPFLNPGCRSKAGGSWEHPAWDWESRGALASEAQACRQDLQHGTAGWQGTQRFPVPNPLLRTGVFYCALAMNSAVTGTLHTSLYSQTTTLDFPELESATIPFPACPAEPQRAFPSSNLKKHRLNWRYYTITPRLCLGHLRRAENPARPLPAGIKSPRMLPCSQGAEEEIAFICYSSPKICHEISSSQRLA